jgi:hypothetical protein
MVYFYLMKTVKSTSNKETLQAAELNPWWIAGFVDGEGCFSISFVKNQTVKYGYQIFTEFVLTQGEKSIGALESVADFFKCGKIYRNNRRDNHREALYRYCVRSRADLQNIVVLFFRKHQLRTAKRIDFEIFAEVVDMMCDGKHLTNEGFLLIKEMAALTNRKKERAIEPGLHRL